MRAIRNTLTRLRSDQSGLSMAELLVAGILTVIVFAVMGTMFVQVAKLTTSGNQIGNSTSNASNAANAITSVVRVSTNLPQLNSATPAPAISDGSNATTLIVFSLSNTTDPTDPVPSKVTFALDTAANRITETRCTGALVGNYYAATSFTTCNPFRVVGDNVTYSGSSDVLFTYRDANGTPMTITGGKLSGTQRAQVASIVVTVRSNPNPSQIRPVLVSNTVVLRNIGLDTGS